MRPPAANASHDHDAEPCSEYAAHDTDQAIADRGTEMAVPAQQHDFQREGAVGRERATESGAAAEAGVAAPPRVIAEPCQSFQ